MNRIVPTIVIAALALPAVAQTIAIIGSNGTTYYVEKEAVASVAGTYNTTKKSGGMELRGGYYFTKNFGVESGTSWTDGSGVFNNVAFGAVFRYPLEKLRLPNVAVYLRAGGLYDWERTTTATVTPGRTYTVDAVTGLPCQAGPTSVTVTGPSHTSYSTLSGWGAYVGPEIGWRFAKKFELFTGAIYEIRDGPNDWKVMAGLRYKL